MEISEFALYRIEQEPTETDPHALTITRIGDVRDKRRLDEVMARFQPALVFHAAAYKHVPLMESENAREALQNNVLGTYRLAMAKLNFARKFVLVSRTRRSI